MHISEYLTLFVIPDNQDPIFAGYGYNFNVIFIDVCHILILTILILTILILILTILILVLAILILILTLCANANYANANYAEVMPTTLSNCQLFLFTE